jgi:hypothetical protein
MRNGFILLLKYACAKYSKDGVRILGIDVLLSRVVVGACHIRKHYRVIVAGCAARNNHPVQC